MKLEKSLPKYIVEFFVLSIAVFMGFLAENFRENLSEKKQESMLMISLLSDLKADTSKLQEIIEHNNRKQNALASFIEIRLLDFSQKKNLIVFYEEWKPTEMWASVRFEPTMATLNQLESTGLLSSTEQTIAADVASYIVTLEVLKTESNNYYKHVEETFRMIYRMADYIAIWNTPPEYPPLLCDEITIMEFFNLSADLMWTVEGYVVQLKQIDSLISELITLIQTEYDL